MLAAEPRLSAAVLKFYNNTLERSNKFQKELVLMKESKTKKNKDKKAEKFDQAMETLRQLIGTECWAAAA